MKGFGEEEETRVGSVRKKQSPKENEEKRAEHGASGQNMVMKSISVMGMG